MFSTFSVALKLGKQKKKKKLDQKSLDLEHKTYFNKLVFFCSGLLLQLLLLLLVCCLLETVVIVFVCYSSDCCRCLLTGLATSARIGMLLAFGFGRSVSLFLRSPISGLRFSSLHSSVFTGLFSARYCVNAGVNVVIVMIIIVVIATLLLTVCVFLPVSQFKAAQTYIAMHFANFFLGNSCFYCFLYSDQHFTLSAH